MTLQKQVVLKLVEKGYHISFAESCTGGLCAATLVRVTSVSEVFNESYVTYANEAKVKLLGVNQADIDEYGVVSEQVAEQMCLGVAKASGSEVGVGVTGIAGPTGGSDKKPVGMVCFGFNINGEVTVYTKQFGDLGRNIVREKSVEFVFKTLLELLDKN